MSVGKPRSYQWTLYLRQILFENRAVGLWHGHDRLCLSRALQLWRLSAATEGGSWKFAMQFAAPANSPVGPLQQAQLQLHASERRVWELEEENARLRCQVIEQAQLPPPTPTQPSPARQQQRAESARRRLEAALASQLHAEEARLAHASAALEALRRAVEEREEHLLRQQARHTADPADPADPCRSCRSLQILQILSDPADPCRSCVPLSCLQTVSRPCGPCGQCRLRPLNLVPTHTHARTLARAYTHPPSVHQALRSHEVGEVQLAALARFRAHRSAPQAWHVLRAHARAVAAPARRAREQGEVACGFAEVQAVQEGRDALGWRAWSQSRPIWPASANQAAGWQRLTEAWGSLRHVLSQLVFDIGGASRSYTRSSSCCAANQSSGWRATCTASLPQSRL